MSLSLSLSLSALAPFRDDITTSATRSFPVAFRFSQQFSFHFIPLSHVHLVLPSRPGAGSFFFPPILRRVRILLLHSHAVAVARAPTLGIRARKIDIASVAGREKDPSRWTRERLYCFRASDVHCARRARDMFRQKFGNVESSGRAWSRKLTEKGRFYLARAGISTTTADLR